MVNVVIKLADVRLQTKARSLLVAYKSAAHVKHTFVYAAPFDASVGVFNKQMRPMLA